MSLTRKHFQTAAGTLRRLHALQDSADWCRGVAFLMAWFADENPRFAQNTFIAAVEATPEEAAQIAAMFNLLKANG